MPSGPYQVIHIKGCLRFSYQSIQDVIISFNLRLNLGINSLTADLGFAVLRRGLGATANTRFGAGCRLLRAVVAIPPTAPAAPAVTES